MKPELITFSSPVAVRNGDSHTTHFINVAEGIVKPINHEEREIVIHAVMDNATKTMVVVNPVARIIIKQTNIRSVQEL